MPFSEFVRYFSRLEFCHLGPESGCFGRSFKQEDCKRRWEMTKEDGEWIRHSTAGGCRNNARTSDLFCPTTSIILYYVAVIVDRFIFLLTENPLIFLFVLYAVSGVSDHIFCARERLE